VTGPLVSVVVPVYNGARFLRQALDSIAAQDYRPFETIVIDDGSTDGSAAIARSYSGLRYLRQANQGVAAARNAGIGACAGQFLAFLDQDDAWSPSKVSRQVEHLLAHPELGFVLAHERLFLEPGARLPPWLKANLLTGDHPGYVVGTLTVRRPVFDVVGLFDASYRMASDTDWFLRAADVGVAMAVLPETLLHRRIHDGNDSHQADEAVGELLEALRARTARRRGASRRG
jgi:glycosyltransferase involved in cell wall biosynthesis